MKAHFAPERRLAARLKSSPMASSEGAVDGRHGDHIPIALPFAINDNWLDALTAQLSPMLTEITWTSSAPTLRPLRTRLAFPRQRSVWEQPARGLVGGTLWLRPR